MEKDRIRVVWICSVSNAELRSHIDMGLCFFQKTAYKLMRKNYSETISDSAHWNTNAIEEFQSIDDVDVHVIFVHSRVRHNVQRFIIGNINFYAVNVSDAVFHNQLRKHILHREPNFHRIHRRIIELVNEINPEIVHIIGAENPPYSLVALSLPRNIPTLVQLQTMLHDPVVKEAYPELKNQMDCEYQVLNRADYIGSKSQDFPGIVRKYIKKSPVFVNTQLLVGEKSDFSEHEKQFDFVYFSNFINKAVDLVVEAFGIAARMHPGLTLDIIGGAEDAEIIALSARLEELGVKDAVTIEGKLPTHDDVLRQIKKARIALLPLKTDTISGTIREAIWNGLPVVTTITSGTPKLNDKRKSALLSPIGDHKALADNMLKLIQDNELAESLKKNGAITIEELFGNNRERASEWVEAYKACISNFQSGKPLPKAIINSN